jgi:Fic/DOC family
VPKEIPTQELNAITSLIQRFPLGVDVDGLRQGLGFSLPERTMQRRLKGLEKEGRITSKGSGKGKRYFPARKATPVFAPQRSTLKEDERDFGTIPLSPSAREIRDIVRGPLTSRVPVGYDVDFLASYVPNETAYLDTATRAELARLGQVGVSELPAGTYIREVFDRLLIDLSWNSSRLEGNTYSLLETELLLARGENAGGRNDEETQMILNHKAAIEMLAEQAGEIGFNRYTICNLHALLSDNLLQDPAACGRVRSRPVLIGGTVFHPLEVPQGIEACFMEILAKAEEITDPFEQAFFAMVHLPYLQPFEDVNKRVSRLSANIPLVRYNLCPLSFIDVPQDDYISGLIGVYELNRIDLLRDVFVWAYRRSASRYSAVLQSLGDPDPFRLRHRARIGEAVRTVVTSPMGKGKAAQWIAQQAAAEIGAAERPRFIEVVETELMSLHEGNIARYRLRPAEFTAWKEGWR